MKTILKLVSFEDTAILNLQLKSFLNVVFIPFLTTLYCKKLTGYYKPDANDVIINAPYIHIPFKPMDPEQHIQTFSILASDLDRPDWKEYFTKQKEQADFAYLDEEINMGIDGYENMLNTSTVYARYAIYLELMHEFQPVNFDSLSKEEFDKRKYIQEVVSSKHT